MLTRFVANSSHGTMKLKADNLETYKPIEAAPGSYVREMGGEVKYPPEDVAADAEAAAAVA